MAKRLFLKKNELNVINLYVNLLKQKGVDVSKVILFGSYAKGTAKPESDIDIAIVSSQFGKNNLKEIMFLRRIALKIDSHLEP